MKKILIKFDGQECLNCGQSINPEDWQSLWDQKDSDHHHYKSLNCPNCSYKNWIKLHFSGSGHDRLFKEDLSPLESTVRVVQGPF